VQTASRAPFVFVFSGIHHRKGTCKCRNSGRESDVGARRRFRSAGRNNVSETWMSPFRRYLANGLLPAEPTEAKIVKKIAGRYTLIDGKLFRHGYTHPILTCMSGEQCTRIMVQLHEGICGSHVGGRALSSKVVRAGYYWPTMREDYTKYAQRCKQCQEHTDWHHAPLEEL